MIVIWHWSKHWELFFFVSHFLCVWHVNKNVLIHCKSTFNIKKDWNNFYEIWQKIIYAHTSKIFATAWFKLQNNYYIEHFDFIDYLNDIWIKSFVKQIIKFYINKIHHFFIIITSRSKDAYRILKHQLNFFIDDLIFVIDNIEILLMNQRKEYVINFDIVKMRMFFYLQLFLFRELIS